MDLKPAQVHQSGYDAEVKRRSGSKERLQIKDRCIIGKLKLGTRMGAIDPTKS